MADEQPLQEEWLSRRELLNGNLLHVFDDEVRLPNGHTARREWIDHPGAAALLPVFANGDVMLVEQYRYPAQNTFMEVPAGKIDAGEDHSQAVVRELKEETGLQCAQHRYLGPYHPCIGYSNEVIHLYYGWQLTEGEPTSDEDEFLRRHRLPFSEALQMIYDGRITDGKTVTTLVKARHQWLQDAPFEINGLATI